MNPLSVVDVEVLELHGGILQDDGKTGAAIDSYVTRFGRAFNYHPTEEAVKAQVARRLADKRAQAQQQQAERVQRARAAAEQRAQREIEDARRREEVLLQDAQLVEASSLSLRKYLITHVVPTLVDGLLDVCKAEPEDPVDHLAEYLFKAAVGAVPASSTAAGVSGTVVSPHDPALAKPFV